jgi:hypothetical protein
MGLSMMSGTNGVGRTARRAKRRRPEVGQLERRALLSDMTAPTTIVASEVGTLGNNGWFVSPVTVNFSATDPDNAPSDLTTFFSVNGGAQQTGDSLTLPNDGIFTVNFHSQDPAGNVEAMHTLIVMIDHSAPMITINASPNILWPPNHKTMTVTVSGAVFDSTSGAAGAVNFRVVDEYGQVAPHGTVILGPNGAYSFTLMLPSSRLGRDKNGRTFTIFATAADEAGNTTTVSTVALVPHDMGHPFDFSGGGIIVAAPSGAGSGGGRSHHHGGGGGHGQKRGKGHRSAVATPVTVVNTGTSGGGENGGGNHGHGHGHGNGKGNQ